MARAMREHRRLFAGLPPRWARAWGEDRFGAFAVARIARVDVRMRWIPPGVFVMGSPDKERGRRADEGPQHVVRLPVGYWLGEFPVTQELWQAVTGHTPSHFRGERRPVECVSWHDCREFCEHVGEELPELAPRLPTEAEWEYACRAGTSGATWTVGELSGVEVASELANLAWYSGNSGGKSLPVGEKPPNPWGLYDMLGNVYEWCLDTELSKYTPAERSAPATVTDGPFGVLRGGSWRSFARNVRAANRLADMADVRHVNLGFRLAAGQESALQYPQARQASRGASR